MSFSLLRRELSLSKNEVLHPHPFETAEDFVEFMSCNSNFLKKEGYTFAAACNELQNKFIESNKGGLLALKRNFTVILNNQLYSTTDKIQKIWEQTYSEIFRAKILTNFSMDPILPTENLNTINFFKQLEIYQKMQNFLPSYAKNTLNISIKNPEITVEELLDKIDKAITPSSCCTIQ
jgi:hypothetical protein